MSNKETKRVKKEDRSPMILVGARQVGKSWIMKEFGKNEYATVA